MTPHDLDEMEDEPGDWRAAEDPTGAVIGWMLVLVVLAWLVVLLWRSA